MESIYIYLSVCAAAAVMVALVGVEAEYRERAKKKKEAEEIMAAAIERAFNNARFRRIMAEQKAKEL